MVQDMNKMETMSLMAAYGSEYAWIESIHSEAEVADLKKSVRVSDSSLNQTKNW